MKTPSIRSHEPATEQFACEYINQSDVFFVGEITPFSAHCLNRLIKQIEGEKEDFADKSIRLHITSPGGSVSDGLKLHDAIASSTLNVTVIAEGFVASAATLLLCATESSRITRNSFLLLHEFTTYMEINYSNLHPHLSYLDKIMECVLQIYNRKLKSPIQKEDLAKDWVVSAQEAVELGLVASVD